MRLKSVIFFILFLFTSLVAFSQIVYSDITKNLAIENHIYFLEDKDNNFGLYDVINSKDFKPVTKKVQNFGITSSAIWLKLSIRNKSSLMSLILQLNQPIIDEVDFYTFDQKLNEYTKVSMGEYQNFNIRKYQTPEYYFDIKIPTDSTRTYYLKILSKENMQIPMAIGTRVSVLNGAVLGNIASGIYVGIMLVMILYNLFIFGTLRDKSYIYYSVYIVFTLLTQTSLQGYTFQFLWPNSPWMATHSPFLFPALVGIVGLEFFKKFLLIKERINWAYKFSFLFFIPYSVSFFLALTGNYNFSFIVMEVTASMVAIFMLVIAFMIYRQGYSEARFFLFAWVVFLLGICIYVLKDFEVLPYNNFTRYTMHFGTAIEVILLSFALADRINILKKDKEESQAEALVVSAQNQKLVREQNVMLEQKVHERTLELEETNEELNVTLSYLKDTQAQLVDAEKMASLGQLTAGIAHEINNPINFVSANLKPLKMDIDDILDLIKKYEEITPESLGQQLKEIEAFKKQIDLDYLKKEMQTLLSGIEDGAKRTTEIVSGLKNFSRLDESDMKMANINEGIESTLVLLKSAIPGNVEVITKLATNIPLIECLPGKLNQVFMNLLSNALYAMEKNKAVKNHRLTISTFLAGDKVCISIADTGTGMTPEIKAKIFEPFFTTKDVGEGTGLGMSIVFKIVESHHAKLEITTEVGKGTTMTLVLNKKINY